jgi:nucleoside-diphosphate-sugar epimerase
MWRDALEAHEAGRIRATEVRPSDYFGADARSGTSVLNSFVIGPAQKGRTVRLITGGPDVPHSWSYLPDIAELAATLATDDRSWGRAWHVPTTPARTVREVAADVAELTGRPAPAVKRIPAPIRFAARVMPVVRELDETRYQFERSFVLDSSAAEATFGLSPTPWRTALERTIEGLARQAAS